MYPKPKKTLMTWCLEIFVAASILLLVGVLAFGLYLSKDGRKTGKSSSSSTSKGHSLQLK